VAGVTETQAWFLVVEVGIIALIFLIQFLSGRRAP
jgi:hypothetical protein